MREKQDYSMYNTSDFKYDHQSRWLSYLYQIRFAVAGNSKKILEVGIGNGTTSQYLKKAGYNVTTVDYEQKLNPDVVADVTNLPFGDKTFDNVLCCEVLEHLPFTEFPKALAELARVSKKYLYITVPDHRRMPFKFSFKLPFLNEYVLAPRFDFKTKHVFDNFHYWEIGKKGYSLSRLIKEIESLNLKIIDHKSPPEIAMVHYFFLEKK